MTLLKKSKQKRKCQGTLRLVTSYQCPFSCEACYAPHNKTITPPKLIRAVIRNAREENFETVAIGGGEPLYTLSHTLQTIKVATRTDLPVAVTTSGYGLTPQSLKQLEKAGLSHLQLSLGDSRTNLTGAYELMTTSEHNCTFGINLLLSPQIIQLLPKFINLFDQDKIDQTTLLLPKGNHVPRLSKNEFMRYYSVLRNVNTKHTAILIDCATQQALNGRCNSDGCSFFPDGTTSKCAFGCSPRKPWNGSLTKAMSDASQECQEGKIILTR